jgi:hypothetical protein
MIDTNSSHYYNITKHNVGTHIKFLIGRGNICIYALYMYDTKDFCHHIKLLLFKDPKFTLSWNNDSMYILSSVLNTYDISLEGIDSEEFILKLTSNSDFQIELFNTYKNESISKNKYISKVIINYKNLKYIKSTIPRLLKLVVDSKLIPKKELLYLADFYSGLDNLI